jgi:hypothetical protein
MYNGIATSTHTKGLHAQTAEDATPLYNAIRKCALRQNTDAFDRQCLPPALLHHSFTPKSNWLYGRNKAPETYHDVEYQAGSFTAIPRHARTIVGAALMVDHNDNGVPALIYVYGETLYVHVYEAPLASLEGDLFQRGESTYLEEEVAGQTLAQKLTDLRRQVGAYMHGAGFGAMPGFLLDGNYHIVRRGPLPALWLRAAKTDHEHELLERALLAACMAVATVDPSRETLECQAPPVWSLDQPLSPITAIVTIFERQKEAMAGVIDSHETAEVVDPVVAKALMDAMDQTQPRANKLALRPVVAEIAWWIAWRSVGFAVALKPPVSNRVAAEIELREFERAEASAMARLSPSGLTLSALVARVQWKTRVAFVGPAAANHVDLLRLANAVCDAGSAALAVRDLEQWFGSGNGQAASAGTRLEGYSQLCGLAQRISEPQAILAMDVDGRTQKVEKVRLINAAVHAHIRPDEAARLVAFPWVVPIIHTSDTADVGGGDTAHGSYLLIERLGGKDATAARDPLHVTDVVRAAYGAAPPPKPRPTVGPEDLERFKRDVLQRIAGMESALKKKDAHGGPSAPTVPTPTDACDYPGRQLVRDTLDVLDRALRKRGIEALAE